MSWFDEIFWPALALVSIVLTILLSVLLSTRLTGKQLLQLKEELTIQIRRLNDRIVEQSRLRPTPLDQSAQRPTVADPSPAAPPTLSQSASPANIRTGQHNAAAAALADRDSFRAFTERYGGTGHVLRPNGIAPAAPDPEFSADVWAIPDPEGLLVYPGYNLRRTQSSLVADSGRVAEERLGWLYHIETGPSLRAIHPARVAKDWSVMKRGVLQVPF